MFGHNNNYAASNGMTLAPTQPAASCHNNDLHLKTSENTICLSFGSNKLQVFADGSVKLVQDDTHMSIDCSGNIVYA